MEISIEMLNKKVCRVCLTSKELQNLYIESNCSVLEKLRSFIIIENKEITELPKWICSPCINSLNDAFDFKEICSKTDQRLRELLKKSNAEFEQIKVKEELEITKLRATPHSKVEEIDIKSEVAYEDDNESISEFSVNDNANDFQLSSDDEVLSKTKERLQKSSNELEESIKCDKCDSDFKSHYRLTKHQVEQHGELYSCLKCDEKFKIRTDLIRHRSVHKIDKYTIDHGQGKYQCDVCNKKYKFKKFLKQHKEKENHFRPTIYQCDICSKILKTESNLKTHKASHLTFEERSKSESIKKYLCSICGKILFSLSGRDVHVRTHNNGEKPFKCSICSWAFNEKSQLEVHMTKHTDDRPFKCEICGFCVKNSQQLRYHKQTHELKSKEKQFECKVCNVKLRYKMGLAHHMRNVHLGIRNYKCDDCDEAFYTSTRLKQHKSKKKSCKVATLEKPKRKRTKKKPNSIDLIQIP